MILLLGGEKGGTGKSTVAVNLATWLARGGVDVIIIDTDPQRTAAQWVERRNTIPDLPRIHCVEKYGNVYDTAQDLAQRYDQVIIDAGGRDSEELRTSLVVANMMCCPIKASQPDIETTVHANELVKLAKSMNPGLDARLVISMATPNPVVKEAAQARELLSELPEFALLQTVIRDRKVYRDAMIEGKGVLELTNEKATAEINQLATEIYGGIR
jgi:chromosome partitioning protein